VTVPQIYVAVLVAVVGAGFCLLQLRRAVRDSINRDRAADARTRVGLPPAAPDNVPGANLADLDECVQILTYTDELEAGYARLWDAITEHRREEDR
jgi:hypothetical protein